MSPNSPRTKSRTDRRPRKAVLIIDMLNGFDFRGGKKLQPRALRAARAISRLKAKARRRGIPVIYVNDNFGKWHSEWHKLYARCLDSENAGREIAKLLRPDPSDYFVLKPKHSAFFGTPLDVLLKRLGVKHLIFTGIALDICVLFSVHDAHVREYKISVPRDCVAAETSVAERSTLALMHKVFSANTAQGTL